MTSTVHLHPDSRALHGRTALHVCADRGHTDCVELLLTLGASVDAQTDSGFTALHLASQRGHLEVVHMLILAGCNPAVQSYQGELPLHVAAANGHQKVVGPLLENCSGDLLYVRNSFGQRPAEVCLDIETARVFQELGGSLIRSRAGSTGSASVCSVSSQEDVLMAEEDCYAGRTLFEEGSVLLRNSRADAVQRLLRGPSEEKSFSTDGTSLPAATPGGSSSGRRRKSFMKLQDKDQNRIEAVGPQSFRLISVLGRGSFGEVFQVAHKTTGQVFAMKVLRKSKIISRNLIRYALTERNLLSYIRHPFIVRLHFAFQTPSCLVLVLHYCSGGSLSAVLHRDGSVPEVVARLYLAEVLLALEHLHARQVIYRDLKPENVVLDEDCHAMLTDFGLSKEGVDNLQGTKSFCGSVAYLAPEILCRAGHGTAVDLYGLGVLLYEMLAGQPPFYSRDRDTLFRNIAAATLQAPARSSAKASQLIFELMQREPAKRLGARETSEVRTHSFFTGLDFDKVLRREVAVPPLRRESLQHIPLLRARDDKVTSPFEGRFQAQVFKTWSPSAQEIEGWEFSGADPPTLTPGEFQVGASASEGGAERRYRTTARARSKTTALCKEGAGIMRPLLVF
mmetsp:Transcript_27262/g.49323  ORF Transcript_27262/g.49323 Transcript_27262/m.49323 type:complete len:622 (+) Transcript_27262:3-1868(+)